MLTIKHFSSTETMSSGWVYAYLVEGNYDGLTVCEGVESSHAPITVTMHADLVIETNKKEIIEVAVNRARIKYEENNRPRLHLTMQNDKRGILEQLGIDENPKPKR